MQKVVYSVSKVNKDEKLKFDLARDNDGKLFFEYGKFFENKISLDDFEEVK